jgi:uridine kinase
MVLILISGCPATGKSTMAANLSKVINAIIIPQDSFYIISPDHYSFDKMNNNDIDDPESINWEEMCKNIVKIRTVTDVNIIVEGHRVFYCDILVELADVLIYLDNYKGIIKKRFMDRYPENYTIRQLEMKAVYFEEKTWPYHEKYVETIVESLRKTDHDKFLYVLSNLERGINIIVDFLKKHSLF